MEYVKEITADLSDERYAPTISAVQEDVGRKIKITLLANNQPYEIPAGASALFRATKPDKSTILNKCEIDGSGNIIAELTQQTLSMQGNLRCQVSICTDEGETLTSAPFMVKVLAKSANNEEITSSNEFNAIKEAYNMANDALNVLEKLDENGFVKKEECEILKGYEDEVDGYCTENGKIKAYKICGPKKNLAASDWEDYIIIACTAHKSVNLGAPLFNVQYKISRDGIFKRQERVKNYMPLEIEWGEWESFAQSSSLEEKISALKEEINEEYAKKTELEDIETALDRIIEIQEELIG